MLTLHYAPGTISVAVLIMLEETGIAYEPVRVDFANAAQTKPPYLAINPKGRVPALITPEGILTETGAILDYLGAVSGQMVPTDPYRAGKMREVMYYLASTMHVNHAHKMRGHRWADTEAAFADMRAKVPQTVAASCAYLEGALAFAPFAVGAEITLADPYLTVVASWAEGDGVDMSAFPRLSAYLAMMQARPAVLRARALP